MGDNELRLVFGVSSDSSKSKTITIASPKSKDELNVSDVKSAMDAIIAAGVFQISNESVDVVKEAYYRTDTVLFTEE